MKSPTYFQLRKNNPEAFASLNRHVSLGGWFKKFGLISLSQLQQHELLIHLPIVGGLMKMVRGLVFGHITETAQSKASEESAISALPFDTTSEKIVRVDVLIIGSGPGGAVAAQHESASENLLVLERGLPPRTSHLNHHNLVHVMNDFNLAGQELILSPNIPQFAQGSVIGGGSEVNSGLYHKLPEKVKDDFIAGLGITYEEWDASESLIENWLEPVAMEVQPSQSVIALGANALGLENVNVPRWRTYDANGNFKHRGMIETFWTKFLNSTHHKIKYGVEVVKIDTSNKTYVRVLGIDHSTGARVEFRANRVHLSAGPISTPYLLAKSGLIKWSDTSFQWHPMIRVIARTQENMLGWNDIDPFQAWTADRKLKFGSAVSTSSLLAINLRRIVEEEESKSLRSYYVSFSSSGRGGIVPFTSMPWYKYSSADRELSTLGLNMLAEMVRAGGGEILSAEELDPMKQSTVHIFGSLPAGSQVFVPGTSRLASDKRVLVSDGSLLPIGPGVNPQGVIMTTVDALLRRGL